MLKDLKQELVKNPQLIIDVLEKFEYASIRLQNNEIRFAIAEGHNSSAIRIKLKNNDNLYVQDFVRNVLNDFGKSCDLISYIIKTKNTDFVTVIKAIKNVLGIDSVYEFTSQKSVFGGFYNRIKHSHTELIAKIHPEGVLNDYLNVYSANFCRDYIDFETQDKFQIGYDIDSQRITIPIRNQYGELIGVKGRATWETNEKESKYLYIIPCPMSTTLFGYCQNYDFLCQADTIYIGESEKFVMQAYSYGYRTCLALGSNSLSATQCKILLELNPKNIVFMLDKGLDPQNTIVNVKKLSLFTRMFDIKIKWWDWRNNTYIPDKASPTDFGKEIFEDIIQNEIIEVNENE